MLLKSALVALQVCKLLSVLSRPQGRIRQVGAPSSLAGISLQALHSIYLTPVEPSYPLSILRPLRSPFLFSFTPSLFFHSLMSCLSFPPLPFPLLLFPSLPFPSPPFPSPPPLFPSLPLPFPFPSSLHLFLPPPAVHKQRCQGGHLSAPR